MDLLDHHMHSEISFDSFEKIENYLKKTENIIVTTEHLDFADPSTNYTDLIPNYEYQCQEIERLNQLHNNRVYMGIEIGWTKNSHPKIKKFLNGKHYDLKLLSVHQNGNADYLEKEKFNEIEKKDIVVEYLSMMIEAVNAMKNDVDILAHFDYGFRVHDISVEVIEQHGKDLFKELCNLIIEHNICFELNTSSMYRHNNLELYHWAVPIYQEQGGTLFVLGSDAHNCNDYQYHFDDLYNFLIEHNIEEVQHLYGVAIGSFSI